MTEPTVATPTQQTVIQAPMYATTLVTAGAGTGKTFTLVQRLIYLVDTLGFNPGSDILVISFSRAAIAELRARLRSSEASARYVRSVTLDSFATRLLSQFAPNDGWTAQHFEGRIQSASELLRRSPEARTRVKGYTHVLVDEIQDFVGNRLELIEQVLELAEGGFTLFGDPAQAIYGFSQKSSVKSSERNVFDDVRRLVGEKLAEVHFGVNHRAVGAAASPATSAGELLRSPNPDFASVESELKAAIDRCQNWGSLKSSAPSIQRSALNVSTAILCRDNGAALSISSALWDNDIRHTLQRPSSERILPAWIGTAIRGVNAISLSEERIRDLIEANPSIHIDSADAFRTLRLLEAGNDPTINVRRLAEQIRTRNIPDIFDIQQAEKMIVSTIHRAKGREYERVVLALAPDRTAETERERHEEARIKYVALSRARRELVTIDWKRPRGLCRCNGRWASKQEWKTRSIEVVGDDSNAIDPDRPWTESSAAPDIQEYLSRSVQVGDDVSLKKREASNSADDPVIYEVVHQGTIIGVTSKDFGRELKSILKPNPSWIVQFPDKITNLRIEAIESVAGLAETTQRSQLGSSGIWLRARVAGLGRIVFSGSGTT